MKPDDLGKEFGYDVGIPSSVYIKEAYSYFFDTYKQNLEKGIPQAVFGRRLKRKNLRTSQQESTDAVPLSYSRLVGANKP